MHVTFYPCHYLIWCFAQFLNNTLNTTLILPYNSNIVLFINCLEMPIIICGQVN